MNKARIVNSLKQLEEFLDTHHVKYVMVIRQLLVAVQNSSEAEVSETSIKELRSLFGGMGSLNDVYICKANGHLVDDEKRANQQFEALKVALWKDINS